MQGAESKQPKVVTQGAEVNFRSQTKSRLTESANKKKSVRPVTATNKSTTISRPCTREMTTEQGKVTPQRLRVECDKITKPSQGGRRGC